VPPRRPPSIQRSDLELQATAAVGLNLGFTSLDLSLVDFFFIIEN
jgi:hypothetical protein